MQRMRRLFALTGAALTALSLSTGSTQAATASASTLLKPDAGRAYPDISADINGKVDYTYNAGTQTGLFHVKNTPYLIAGGPSAANEFAVAPNSDTGVRSQEIQFVVDKAGNLVTDASNKYELYGTITTPDATYSGLLLKGTPTGFGYQDLNPVGITGSDIFDVNINVTGGQLADYFGSQMYLRITPELQSTFSGKFDENFSAAKATSNSRSYNAPKPFPIPEPTTVMLYLVGTAGLVYHQRRRLTAGR